MADRILVVEDDRSISGMVSDYLTGEGFESEIFESGEGALQAFTDERYALALIDLMLPDMSGMEVIRAIRRESTVPVIIITAKDNDTDKVMGLHLGADDYVVKPFSLIELTARIRAHIRRAARYENHGGEETIRLRELEIDADRYTARIAGAALDLTRTEFEILRLLAAHPGQAFSKERLYEMVWKEPYYGNENVLNTHINRLRGKLKAASKEGDAYIKTLWGIGYKMEGE